MEEYGDEFITSKDAKIPRWLFWSYWLLLVWGFIWMALYWNGAQGWIDRGFWFPLEQAANTTVPFRDANR